MIALKEAQALAKQLRAHSKNMTTLSFNSSLSTAGQKPQGRIYEFFVVLAALNYLAGMFSLRIKNGTGRWVRFPNGPSHKARFPYLEAIDSHLETVKFQICLGTKVHSTKSKFTFAPDLTIQRAKASLKPTGADILLAWDAKFVGRRRLSTSLTKELASSLRLLDIPPAVSPFASGSGWPIEHSIVTNAAASTLENADLQTLEVGEVYNFVPGKTPRVRP